MNRKNNNNNALQLSGSFLFNKGDQQNHQVVRSQYRATQLWHSSLQTFLSGVPLSRHRYKTKPWKVYESSFTGAEAVSWFQEQIREKLDKDISREQTKKLLGKFYRAGAFKRVEYYGDDDGGEKKGNGAEVDEKDFKDSQLHIYRLGTERPAMNTTSSSSSVASKTPSPLQKKIKKNYSIEIKPLTVTEKEAIYYDLMMECLRPLVSVPLPPQFEKSPPNGNIFINLSCNTSTSTSSLFPGWIVTAMNYLKNYPAYSSLHVDYPNFEYDVFILVFDYFFSYYERVDRLLSDVDLFITVWNNIEPQLPYAKYQEKFPFPKSEFDEIDEIFTPRTEKARRFVMGKNRRRLEFPAASTIMTSENSGFTSMTFDDSAKSASSASISYTPQPMNLFDESRYRTSVYYATSFDVKSPITRVLSQNELYAYDNPSLNLSPADLINHPKYGRLRRKLDNTKAGKIKKSFSVGDLADGDESSDDDGGFLKLAEVEKEKPPGPDTKRPTLEALSLLLLTLPMDKRKHLEVLLTFMGKVASNDKLELDVAVSNKDLVYDKFARVITGLPSPPTSRTLISFMIENVDNLFNGEYLSDLKEKAEKVVSEKQIKLIPIGPTSISANNENNNNKKGYSSPNSKENLNLLGASASFCSRVTMSEFDDHRFNETSKSLRDLLDAICEVKDEKIKKKQLKKFQKEYPHIYSEKLNNANSTISTTSSSVESSPFQQQKHKKRTPFGILI